MESTSADDVDAELKAQQHIGGWQYVLFRCNWNCYCHTVIAAGVCVAVDVCVAVVAVGVFVLL